VEEEEVDVLLLDPGLLERGEQDLGHAPHRVLEDEAPFHPGEVSPLPEVLSRDPLRLVARPRTLDPELPRVLPFCVEPDGQQSARVVGALVRLHDHRSGAVAKEDRHVAAGRAVVDTGRVHLASDDEHAGVASGEHVALGHGEGVEEAGALSPKVEAGCVVELERLVEEEGGPGELGLGRSSAARAARSASVTGVSPGTT
jgi:hypothetical protein